jgi:hypothetical protein
MLACDKMRLGGTRNNGESVRCGDLKRRAIPKSIGSPPRYFAEAPLGIMELKCRNCGKQAVGSTGICMAEMHGTRLIEAL